jgi:flagellar biosynthesis GTPase FlhF
VTNAYLKVYTIVKDTMIAAAKYDEKAGGDEAATKKKDETVKKKPKAEAAKKKTSASADKKKKDEAAAKKKAEEESKKKAEEEAAAKKAEEEAAAAPKADEGANSLTSKEACKARDAAWKKLPPAEQKKTAIDFLQKAKEGKTAEVVKMIADGVSANAIDGDGWTALTKAAEMGKHETMAALLDHGADTSMPVKLGEYDNLAIHHAAKNGHKEAVKLLLARGKKADLSKKNFLSKTPREYATDDSIKSMIKKAMK